MGPLVGLAVNLISIATNIVVKVHFLKTPQKSHAPNF